MGNRVVSEMDWVVDDQGSLVGVKKRNNSVQNLVSSIVDPITGEIDFSGKLAGNLANGEWFNPPSIFRLLLNGTGTVTIDSKDAAGTITTGVYSTTLSSAVNEIAFPYAGDSAIQIRATLTGTATAKVV
jgi:hypothetical protein